MPYLFDTDIISAMTRSRPHTELVRRVGALPIPEQFSSTISLAETLFGAYRRGRSDLVQRIEGVFGLMGMLPFDESAARVFARLKVELERAGTPLDEPDLRIAAIAVALDLTLVTGNERHFRRVAGLRVENWLADPPANE